MFYKITHQDLLKRTFLILDLIFLPMIFICLYVIRLQNIPDTANFLNLFFILISYISLSYLIGNFNYNSSDRYLNIIISVFGSALLTSLLLFSVMFLVRYESEGILGRGIFIGGLFIFSLLSLFYRGLFLKWYSGQVQRQNWLILTSKEYYINFYQDLKNYGAEGSYYFLLNKVNNGEVLGHDVLGSVNDLNKILDEKTWSGIIVGLSDSDMKSMSSQLMDIRFQGGQVIGLREFYEEKWQKVPVYFLSKSWFVLSKGFSLVGSPVKNRIKRFFDIVSSLLLLILTLPIMLIVIVLIRLCSRGPIIFKQNRVGQFNHTFTIYKFRSMLIDAEKNGAQWAKKTDSRVTYIGKYLRKLRLDELPQLVNVLRGNMSFIGPRPERPEFMSALETQVPHFKLRHLLKPGITGWAQVMYRYGVSITDSKEKLQYDLYYLKNYSLAFDLLILLKTVKIVIGGKGH